MTFNQRTSFLIQSYFGRCSALPVYVRVLQLVYKHAFREKHLVSPDGEQLLLKSRDFRHRLWWECFRFKSDYAKRRRLGLLHVFPGSLVHWEDIFCDTYGVYWRLFKDTCSSLSEWMEGFPAFCRNICRQCGLWDAGLNVSSLGDPCGGFLDRDSDPEALATKRRKTCGYRWEDFPSSHCDDALYAPSTWEKTSGCFVIISD